MLKTLKRKIALVAVAALGAGGLSIATAPVANAAVTAGAITLAGSTNLATSGTAGTWLSRTSFSSLVVRATVTAADTDVFNIYLGNAADNAVLATGVTAATGTIDDVGTTVQTATVTAPASGIFVTPATGAGNQYTEISVTLGDLAAGSYKLYVDTDATFGGGISTGIVKVVDAGAPTSISWSAGITEIGAYNDQDYTLTFKDALSRATVAVNNEKAVLANSGVASGAGANTLEFDANQSVQDKADAANATTLAYTVGINTDSATVVGGLESADPVSGTVYTTSAQLQDGNSALAAPVSITYKYMASTVGLAGTIGFYSANTSTATEITSISTATNVASENIYAKLIDDGGRQVIGATVSYTAATVTANAIAAGTTTTGGFTGAFAVTVTAGTTGTVTAAVSTGGASISKALTINNSAVATTGASTLSVSSPTTDIYADGTTTYTALTTKLNPATVTGTIVVSGSGATASSVLPVVIDGTIADTATDSIVANGITFDSSVTATKTIYVSTDSAGKFTVTLDVSGATIANNDSIVVTSDVNATAGAKAVITLGWQTAALAYTTTPATTGKAVKKIGEAVSVAISAVDQYGNGFANYIGSAKMAGIPTGGASTVTGATATGRTGLDGKLTLTVAAPSTTFAGDATLTTTLLNPSGAAIGGVTASTVTVTYSTDGSAATFTVTDSDADADMLTTDNKATRAVYVDPTANEENDADSGVNNVDNYVALTSASTTPAGVAFTATATNGIRLLTTTAKNSSEIAVGKSEVTGIAGTTTVFAIPTKIGAGTITFVGGGKTVVYTLTGALAAAPLASSVTLTVAANGGGKATVDLKTLDAFGNGVPATVDIVVTGPAYLSNGFKNFQVSTASATGTNSFDLVASGTAGAVTITATITNATYQTVTAANATLTATTASDQDTTLDVTIKSDGAAASPTDAAVSAVKSDVTAVKADVKAVSDTVATLSKAVTTIQSSVTELTSSFSAQIKSLSAAIAKISKAIAALSKKIK